VDAEVNGLTADVVAYVRNYIAVNRLKPGDRLPGETEIAKVLGISRPVVREASRTLLALGTIATAPGRAPRVSGMAPHVLRHVFEHAIVTGEADAGQVLEVRRGLEIAMAAQAATGRDDATVAILAQLSEAMGARLRNPEVFVRLDLDFHRTLAAATANPFYVVLIEACRAAFAVSMDAGLRRRLGHAELERVHHLHVEIVDGVRQRDAAAAADAMTRHFDDALAALYRTPKKASARARAPNTEDPCR
jgi:GntR family transcriptional repressor for pyruvate dehydrogenase complex